MILESRLSLGLISLVGCGKGGIVGGELNVVFGMMERYRHFAY
jgi:hypothetical protein